MHSRMLVYLDEVARAGSIRKAAEKLNVASSSINRQILALEAELGAPIFERMHKHMRLTATGELLIAHVRDTLRDHRQLRERIVDMKGWRRGLVRIATMAGLANTLLPDVVIWMRERHPFVKLVISALSVNQVTNAVITGEADLGFAFNLPDDPKLRVVASARIPIGAVMAPDHPLANRETIRLGDCLGYPLIVPDRGMTIGRLVADGFERAGVTIDMAIESNSLELLKQTASRSQAVTFLNEIDVAVERRRGELVFLPLLDEHMGPHMFMLVHRTKGRLDAAQSLVMEELRKIIRETPG
ncbi:LysR family transcriptional regulator [Skermanella stibiiresistens SB22]|uniref:LysR family transcriptional regulator n=1 Tax=Skermanella stibiiresistens SB22 TaxID=1385369 RepID=W9GUS2_9PROT|nr:LysR family transcriptional regulator [Skermanella stibiiresistens SB22]